MKITPSLGNVRRSGGDVLVPQRSRALDGTARTVHMTRFPLLVLLWLTFAACSGTGSTRQPEPVTPTAAPKVITFRDYRTNLRLGIVNDGFLASRGFEGPTARERRVTYYSTPGVDVMVKATSDRLLEGLLDFLEDQGFSRYAMDGPAPPESVSNNRLTTSLEIIIEGRARTWLFDVDWTRTQPAPKAMSKYLKARNVFLEAHREIEQYATGGANDWNFDGAGGTVQGGL